MRPNDQKKSALLFGVNYTINSKLSKKFSPLLTVVSRKIIRKMLLNLTLCHMGRGCSGVVSGKGSPNIEPMRPLKPLDVPPLLDYSMLTDRSDGVTQFLEKGKQKRIMLMNPIDTLLLPDSRMIGLFTNPSPFYNFLET